MEGLRQLAHYYGLQTEYLDVRQHRCQASADAVLRVLQVLGAPILQATDVPDALRARRQECWRTRIEPVVVVWDGRNGRVQLRVPRRWESQSVTFHIELETGEARQYSARIASLPTRRTRRVESEDYLVQEWALPEPLPWGYHRLHVDLPGEQAEALLLAAPRVAYAEPPGGQERFWGVFLPLYALHRQSSWGAGDFSDLEALMRWVADQGGSLVATLPLLSTLWELGGDPSPYQPASRLFWNEFYLDVTRVPEFPRCAEAQRLLGTTEVREQLDALRQSPRVDYTAQMHLKRQVLEALARQFAQESAERRLLLEDYCQQHPEVDDFARFRAVGERQGRFWTQWPEPLRNGWIEPGDYDEGVYQYHRYTQWQIQQQLQAMSETARQAELLWYLDVPLGVSGDGYDAWRHREVFALEVAGGAPPDAFFTKGQNWGFPPLHPQALRQQGYRYLIASLEQHLRYASVLRIDHIMNLHRLYWVPDGFSARDGVYVRYPREELFAVLTLQSHRHRAWILGENLGTVPEVLNAAMQQHGVGEMFVVQYELHPEPEEPMRPVPERCVAALNTHDMPPFAAFWTGADLEDRLDLGLLDEAEVALVQAEQSELREALVAYLRTRGLLGPGASDPAAVLEACLTHLATSRAAMVLVNLEDLWQETLPQNTPGTWSERPNWQRKTRYAWEQFRTRPDVVRILRTVNAGRRRPPRETETPQAGQQPPPPRKGQSPPQ